MKRRVMDPDHHYVLQQLHIRKEDQHLDLTEGHVMPVMNRLAIYLAEYGLENYTKMVTTTKAFGRVNKLWMEDMGLDPARIQFWDLDEVEDDAMDAEIAI